MSWTYTGDPSTSDRDKVRMLAGDVDQLADVTLTDQEIAYLLSVHGSARPAAAAAADALASRYSQLAVIKNLDGLMLDRTQVIAKFRDVAAQLRDPRRGGPRPAPFVGGQSVSDKDRHLEDEDEVQPYFRRGMQESAATPPDVPGSLTSTVF